VKKVRAWDGVTRPLLHGNTVTVFCATLGRHV
jgi:hypothetical protein